MPDYAAVLLEDGEKPKVGVVTYPQLNAHSLLSCIELGPQGCHGSHAPGSSLVALLTPSGLSERNISNRNRGRGNALTAR